MIFLDSFKYASYATKVNNLAMFEFGINLLKTNIKDYLYDLRKEGMKSKTLPGDITLKAIVMVLNASPPLGLGGMKDAAKLGKMNETAERLFKEGKISESAFQEFKKEIHELFSSALETFLLSGVDALPERR